MFSVLLTVIATFPIFVTFLVVCLKSHWKLKGEENQNKKLSVEEVYVKNDKPAPVKEKVKKVEKKVKKPEKNVKKPDGKDKKTKNLAKFFIFNKEEDLKTPIHSDLSLNSTQNTWKSEDDEHESLIGSAIFTDMENLGNLKLLPPQPEGYAEKLRAKVRKERKGKKSPPDYLCPEEEDSLFNIPSLVPDQATLASPKSLVPLDIQDSRVLRHQQDLLAYKKSHSIFSHASLPNAIPSTDSLSRGSEPSEVTIRN